MAKCDQIQNTDFTLNKMAIFEITECVLLGIMYSHDVCFFMLLFMNFVFTISKRQHQLV